MSNITEKLFSIADDPSRNGKEATIKSLKDDKEIMYLLYFLSNPYITTGLSTKKIAKKVTLEPDIYFTNLIDALEYVSKNNTGTDQIISNVRHFILSQKDAFYQALLFNIFTKTFRLGATAKTMNKVFPGFVPEFNVQLAYKYEDCIKNLIDKRIVITLKLDGMRCICVNDTQPTFFTRAGQEIEELDELKEEFKKLPKGVYDGELLAIGDFSDTNERFRETLKIARKKGVKTGLKMICFDYIEDINDFKSGKDTTPYYVRAENLSKCIDRTADEIKSNLIEMLHPLYVGKYDEAEITRLSRKITSDGEEGIMINVYDSPYECKRTKNLVKVKKFYNVDLRVTGFQEGTGALEGKLGSLLVNYKGYEVAVGSGFTKEQREQIWLNRFEVIGSIIEVGYFEETVTDNGISLRFPTFIAIRNDKDEESYN